MRQLIVTRSKRIVLSAQFLVSAFARRHKRSRLEGWQLRARRASTFVSQHFELPSKSVVDYLSSNGLSYRVSGKHAVVRECPLCGKPTRGKQDNMYKLYVQMDTGVYFCHRCGSKGSWFDFKRALGGHAPAKRQQDSQAPTGASYLQAGTAYGIVGAAASSPPQRGLQQGKPREKSSGKGSSPIESASDAWTAAGHLQEAIEGLAETPAVSASARSNRHSPVAKWLVQGRGLSPEVLAEYKVGAADWGPAGLADAPGRQPEQFAVFPLLSRTEQVRAAAALSVEASGSSTVAASEDSSPGRSSEGGQGGLVMHRCKLRSVSNKAKQMLLPKGGEWGLFGLHAVPPGARSIVLTEGELDAMSVRQATGVPAVSLPNGCRSLPLEVVPLLEPFETVFLWLDDDQSGHEGALKMAQKLGTGRCRIVRTSDGVLRGEGQPEAARPKDANDALRLPGGSYSFTQALERSEPLPHKEILRFADLRHAIQHELRNPDLIAGTPWRVLPGLQKLLKGHRSGELTVLTGPTGAGKTTLLSQLSLDLAAQGVPTLWGSFEVKNARLAKKMLQQYMGAAVVDTANPQALEAAADAFEELPLYFLRFFGGSPVEDVLDAMEYAVYAHDVSHIVLDNLQFMMAGASGGAGGGGRAGGRGGRPRGGGGGAFERFEAQEAALDHFRRFASQRDVHVTLVIHPRKEPEDAPLTLSSVFGTAKATQEADNVLILQRAGDRKRLDVRKNRHDGSLGGVELGFDPATQMMVEASGGKAGDSLPIAMMEASAAAGGAAAAGVVPAMRAGALDFLHTGGKPPAAMDAGDAGTEVGGAAGQAGDGIGSSGGTEDAAVLRRLGLGPSKGTGALALKQGLGPSQGSSSSSGNSGRTSDGTRPDGAGGSRAEAEFEKPGSGRPLQVAVTPSRGHGMDASGWAAQAAMGMGMGMGFGTAGGSGGGHETQQPSGTFHSGGDSPSSSAAGGPGWDGGDADLEPESAAVAQISADQSAAVDGAPSSSQDEDGEQAAMAAESMASPGDRAAADGGASGMGEGGDGDDGSSSWPEDEILIE